MNTSTHIVVGYDGSPDSDKALTWAARTASLTGDEVVATIVVDPMETPRGTAWPESWWKDIEDRARGVLAEGPDVQSRVERHVAQPVALLADRADDASAVVLGSRGHGVAGEIFLGSVSQGVARRARVPVVVVRAQQNPASNRIVVGVDGSEASIRALELACARADLTAEKVVALHAWFPTTVALDRYGYVPPVSGETAEEAKAILEEIVGKARVEHPEVEIVTLLRGETASRALVDASEDASLVVVGSRGRGAVAQALLGSTSHDVIHHAHCPVAVVR
ncbi:MAG TPA: universal stress protein [Nocardioides sp.]|jgi:nucleotide-binding universal stress UspA family protein|nr:universal stress protein [Nocardioides sp.]